MKIENDIFGVIKGQYTNLNMKYGKMPLLSERHSKPNSATLILRERAAAFHGHLVPKSANERYFTLFKISYKFKGI